MNPEREELRAAMKNASQWAVFWGGIAFIVGSLICLAYLLIKKPWRLS